MLLVYANDVNITEYVEKNSIRITEQLNNRSNICDFVVLGESILHTTRVEVYEVFELRAQASSGQAVLSVMDTFEFYEVMRADDEITLDIKGVNKAYATIDSIDHDAKTVTMTANLATTLPKGTYCGRLVFSGNVSNNPDEEMGHDGTLIYSVSCTDQTNKLNRKNVVDTYENMYMREIISRMLYQFCARDSEEILDTFEATRTEGGVGLAMSDETTDRIVGSKSQATGTTGSGTATRTKTLGATVDISAMTDVRLRHKTAENEGQNITSMKVRIGNDASNYLQRSSTMVGTNKDDCWNRENFKIDRATETGSVDLETVDRVQIEVVCTAALGSGDLLFDQLTASVGGFTLKNCIRGDVKFVDFRAQYKRPSDLIETLTKRQSLFRFVDYNRDVHVFKQNNVSAPFGIDDTSENYADLQVEYDTTMIRNRQTVKGGEAPSSSRYTQDSVCDGLQTSRQLDYKPSDLEIYIAYQDFTITGATWAAGVAEFTTSGSHGFSISDEVAVTAVDPEGYNGSFVVASVPSGTTFTVAIVDDPGTYSAGGKVGAFQQKTVGVQNLVGDPTSVDYLFNFQEKVVIIGGDDTPPAGAVFRRYYFPYQQISVRTSHAASIAAMKLLDGGDGIFDGPIINDSSIQTFPDARRRAQAELSAYANPQITIDFKTQQGGLHAGQIIHITDSTRGIDDDYVIQKLTRSQVEGAMSSYTVSCSSTLFGLIEFFQLLLKKSGQVDFDASELVDVVVNQDETIVLTAAMIRTKKSKTFRVASVMSNKRFDFTGCQGNRSSTGVIVGTNGNKQRYAEISAGMTAEVGFDNTSNHVEGSALYIDIASYSGGASGKSAKARNAQLIPVKGSTEYDIYLWLENLAADGIVGGDGLDVTVEEFTANSYGTPVQSTSILSGRNTTQDFDRVSGTFTTHASTTHVCITLELAESTGKVSLSDILLQEQATESVSNPGIASFCEVV